jgi:hypothetical protein
VLIYRVTPTVLPLILKKYHYGLSWMYFCCYFVLSNHSNWEFICIILVRSFLVKIWVFDPLGCSYIGLPPTVLPLIFNKYHYGLSWMYICCYFVLSNHSNWEFIYIIPVFEVIFGQNMGIWPPGVTLIILPPAVW